MVFYRSISFTEAQHNIKAFLPNNHIPAKAYINTANVAATFAGLFFITLQRST